MRFRVQLVTTEPEAEDLLEFMRERGIERVLAEDSYRPPFEEYVYTAKRRGDLEDMIYALWAEPEHCASLVEEVEDA